MVKRSSRRISISFQEQPPQVREIPPLDDYSEQEVDQIWYSPEEKDEMVREAVRTANGWGSKEDTRGLELFSDQAQQELRGKRGLVVSAVLKEQARLRDSATTDDAAALLALCSYNLSMYSQDLAYLRGYDDYLALSASSSVSFKDQPDVIEIETLEEYSEHDREQLWYSLEDREEIIEDTMDAANGWIVEGQEEPRGLEIFSEQGQWALFQRRQTVVHTVLKEQLRLRTSMSENGDELLAECSYKLTVNSQDQAYLRGYKDEVEGVPKQFKSVAPSTQKTTGANPLGEFAQALSRPFKSFIHRC